MSNVGVHDFAIPHEFVQPTRDMAIIHMPRPPKQIGSIQLPDMFRDVAQHNVMAGRIVAMGPVAFMYKDGNDTWHRHDVKIGDWVAIRPYAGTMVVGGKVQGIGGFRYVSTFQDVIGIIPADKMPDPATLLWDDNDEQPQPAPQPVPQNGFGGEPRESLIIKS